MSLKRASVPHASFAGKMSGKKRTPFDLLAHRTHWAGAFNITIIDRQDYVIFFQA